MTELYSNTATNNAAVEYKRLLMQLSSAETFSSPGRPDEDAAPPDPSATLAALHGALDYYERIEHKRGIAAATEKLGNFYHSLNDDARAAEMYRRAWLLSKELGLLHAEAHLTTALGTLCSSPASPAFDAAAAEELLLQGITLCGRLALKEDVSECHGALAALYERQGHYEQAVEHYKQHEYAKNEALAMERQRLVQKFEFEGKLADAEYRYALELRIAQQQQEMLVRELEFHRREAEESVRQLAGSNRLLDYIAKEIKYLLEQPEYRVYDGLGVLRTKVASYISPLDDSGETGKKWLAINDDFMKRLNKRYPALTATELKIAALLTMDLSTAQIAAVIFISPRTVETHRLSIRRKMKLGRTTDIVAALQKIAAGA